MIRSGKQLKETYSSFHGIHKIANFGVFVPLLREIIWKWLPLKLDGIRQGYSVTHTSHVNFSIGGRGVEQVKPEVPPSLTIFIFGVGEECIL